MQFTKRHLADAVVILALIAIIFTAAAYSHYLPIVTIVAVFSVGAALAWSRH